MLRCDIFSGLRPAAASSVRARLGRRLHGAKAATPTCAGDTVNDPKAPVLPYGRVWKQGSFTCLSSCMGLSCANRAGYGFFLSRESWQVG